MQSKLNKIIKLFHVSALLCNAIVHKNKKILFRKLHKYEYIAKNRVNNKTDIYESVFAIVQREWSGGGTNPGVFL